MDLPTVKELKSDQVEGAPSLRPLTPLYKQPHMQRYPVYESPPPDRTSGRGEVRLVPAGYFATHCRSCSQGPRRCALSF